MSNKTGIPGPWEQPSRYGRTEAGEYATVPYEDVSKDRINALALEAGRLGYNYHVDHTFGKSRLEIDYSFNPSTVEQPEDKWEYIGQEVQKDLLSAVVPSGITGRIAQANIETINKAVQHLLPDTSYPVTLATFTGTDAADALTVYNLYLHHYEDVIVQAPVLRHSQVVSQIYPITLSKLNIGRIYTTASLIAEQNPPSWAVTGLPNDPAPNFGIALAYGWRKGSPTIQEIALRKNQIVQEFQYGLWPLATLGVSGQFI